MLLTTLTHETLCSAKPTLRRGLIRVFMFSVCVMVGLISLMASAGEGRQHRSNVLQGQGAPSQAATISPQQAAAIAKQGQDSKVLKVDRNERSYRVKLITADGVVKQVVVDATTGRIVGQ